MLPTLTLFRAVSSIISISGPSSLPFSTLWAIVASLSSNSLLRPTIFLFRASSIFWRLCLTSWRYFLWVKYYTGLLYKKVYLYFLPLYVPCFWQVFYQKSTLQFLSNRLQTFSKPLLKIHCYILLSMVKNLIKEFVFRFRPFDWFISIHKGQTIYWLLVIWSLTNNKLFVLFFSLRF